jgi:transcriptional regulator with PAS, ATPase and Fis domain
MIEFSDDSLYDNFYDSISTSCELFHKIFSFICCITSTDIPVLIDGEAGMWKPSIAQVIHKSSKRKHGDFLIVDCSNPDENALEIELFGHEQEASYHQKIGKLEQAHGGSILLDEVGMTPSAIQARLLQVIQDKEIYRVGGTNVVSIDVRIIATTSESLESAVKLGRFREDLFYRIVVFPIYVPPLRTSRRDIKFLADYFLQAIAKKTGKPIISISDDAMNLLMDYDWPGNIKEMKEAIEYAVSVEKHSKIQSKSLPKEIHPERKVKSALQFGNLKDKIIPLEEIEKQVLIQAMKLAGNNVQIAAKALGINRATVYRKLDKYNLLIKH